MRSRSTPIWTYEDFVSSKTTFIGLIVAVVIIDSSKWDLFSSKNFHFPLLHETTIGPGRICLHKIGQANSHKARQWSNVSGGLWPVFLWKKKNGTISGLTGQEQTFYCPLGRQTLIKMQFNQIFGTQWWERAFLTTVAQSPSCSDPTSCWGATLWNWQWSLKMAHNW